MTIILALDIATNTGWAYGPAGRIEKSGSVRLRHTGSRTREDDPVHVAWSNMGFWLRDTWVFDRPDVIVAEAPMPPGEQSGGLATQIAFGCLAAMHTMAALYEIPVRYAHVQTWRKHYTGKSSHNPPPGFKPNLRKDSERRREWNKHVTMERAKQLKHIPFDSKDDNRADACGMHDWASHHFYRRGAPAELQLFGMKADL